MNKFQQWICSKEFYDLAQAYRVASIAIQAQAAEEYQRLQDGIIEAEQRARAENTAEAVEVYGPGFSRYTPAILQFQRATGGAAVYCFVIDGKLGTGGMPMVSGLPPPQEYRRRCEELIALLRRSAELLEQDLARQVPHGPGAGSVG